MTPAKRDQAEPAGPSRRAVLKGAGFSVAAVAGTASVAVPFAASQTSSTPPRTTVPAAQALRIDHVTVVDPRDGRRRPDRSVLVRGGKIVSVTAAATAPAAAGVRVIDGAGRFVVPGYNNMHTHVLQEGPRSRLFLATMLAEGTTGMRQMAGSDQLLRNRAENRLGLDEYAPRLLAMPGALLMPFNAPSIARARREISRQKALGADFIKLIQVEPDVFFDALSWAHENGLKVAGHLPATVSPTQAAEAGFDSLEHLGTSINIWIETSREREALRQEEDTASPIPNWLGYVPYSQQMFTSGIATKATSKTLLNPALLESPDDIALLQRALDSFDEGAAEDLARSFARNNTWQTPTLVRLRSEYLADAPEYANHPWLSMISPEARSSYQDMRRKFLALPSATRSVFHRYYETTLNMIQRIHDAGTPIMSGTDGPSGNPGHDLQSEFREMARAGLTPLDILRSTTTVPAAFLGRSDRMGAVARGMDADFLLLEADPLAKVEHLGTISAVVREGHYHTREDIGETVDRLLTAAEA
ncbi:amidohydrolase family protein [Kineosporia sp. NBRC 101731]|uniref:amidohydrolase family protein n=1 Tax=Kineosporia sp. NBRC 101731 TaxID=3032199 RepID=UPI0024A11249|nr:amidohydrolase family protein [Kineosporia sp. NBRC 101731]GLY29830.1 amidohydrolase [Kineosporia sp. NBRC 101731]